MTDLNLVESLRRELVADCELDYLGLGQVAFRVGEALDLEDPAELRSVTLRLIQQLLADRLIEAGMPEGMDQPAVIAPPGESPDEWLARARPLSPGDWKFEAWAGSPSEVVARIGAAWRTPSGGVDLDGLCWFRATDEGQRKTGEWRAERHRLHRS